MAICLGSIGMSRTDFWESEWREILAALYGYYRARNEQTRTMWEQAQIIAYSAARPHYKELRPDQIIDLPWKRVKEKPLTPEQKAKQIETHRRWDIEEKKKWDQKQKQKIKVNGN